MLKGACAVLFGAALLTPSSLFAAQYRGDSSGSVAVSGAVEDDLYAGGASVSVAAPVGGDLVIAGGSIISTGSVGGGVLAAGGNITVSGSVGDDIRALGGNIFINGPVENDVVILGGQTVISSTATVGKDLVILGGNVTVEGAVRGNLYVRSGDVTLNSAISGSADIGGRRIVLGPNASIGGKLIYSAPAELNIPPGTARGGVEFRLMEMRADSRGRDAVAAIFTIAFLVKMLTLLVLALVLAAVFRRRVTLAVQESLALFGWDLLRGFAGFILIPVAALILLVTVIGAPIAVVAIAAYVIMLVFAGIMAPILLGSLLWKIFTRASQYAMNAYSIIVGVLVYCLLSLIPLVGWVFGAIFMLVAFGSFMRSVLAAMRSAQESRRAK